MEDLLECRFGPGSLLCLPQGLAETIKRSNLVKRATQVVPMGDGLPELLHRGGSLLVTPGLQAASFGQGSEAFRSVKLRRHSFQMVQTILDRLKRGRICRLLGQPSAGK